MHVRLNVPLSIKSSSKFSVVQLYVPVVRGRDVHFIDQIWHGARTSWIFDKLPQLSLVLFVTTSRVNVISQEQREKGHCEG